ncbi:MAG: endonuclease MutS2 [Nitrospirales bacterium]|nr:endonuclease MutS2 [Nitrospira sp.]MDR4502808.1 endonuclease MutS2 [Nitrospirales bacterium]
MSQDSLQLQARQALEWEQLLSVLARYAQSKPGARACLQLPLETNLPTAAMRLQETTEMRMILECARSFPILAFDDIEDLLNRSAKGAQLEGVELYSVSVLLDLCAEVSRAIMDFEESCPTISVLAYTLDPLSRVYEAIVQCVDHEGNIQESATPELSQLVQHLHQLRQQIRQRLERLLSSHEFEELLQGQYFAQRGERYVIPVKSDKQHHISGIVHDISGSGATVFIEPRDFIELNNAIKVADLQVKQEIGRILQDLSSLVASHVTILLQNFQTLRQLDCLGAKARLSITMRANPVSLNRRQHVMLKEARHPLLVMNKRDVVANDIHLPYETPVCIVSGPNTGGKTATLKLLGMFALMVRAGLHLPCHESSEMAIFERIYADIGDAQDLERDLSSFSAHITNMIAIMNDTLSSRPEAFPPSLVLLDEIGNATDPAEGAAIAEALLCRLHEQGFKVIVTTHYHSLKTMPLRKPGFMNASHEFDLVTMSPTYRLIEGLPGGSSALEIAGQLGLDPLVLSHASTLLQGQERDLEFMFQELQNTQHRLDHELRQAQSLRVEAERFHQEAREVKERVCQSERQERQKVRKNLQAELAHVKRELHTMMEELKSHRTLFQVKSTRQKIVQLQQQSEALLDDGETGPLRHASVGEMVAIKDLGTHGILLEPIDASPRVKVQVGEKIISVDAQLLRSIHASATPQVSASSQRMNMKGKAKKDFVSENSGGHVLQSVTPSLTIDLRGKSVDEAIESTEAAFDHAVLQGHQAILVIHGHGTGKLKAALRTLCSASPYVLTYRPGERGEGGDGATVVSLR